MIRIRVVQVSGGDERNEMRRDFMEEMQRFLPAVMIRETVGSQAYWTYLTQLIEETAARALAVTA